jgi:hypothetical protein
MRSVLGTMETSKVRAAYTEEKDRIKKRGDNRVYNYKMNIME